MAFVKLSDSILDSSLWIDRDERDVFITALLMATPLEIDEPAAQLHVREMEPTGWVVPPGWYGWIPAAGPGIVRRALVDASAGLDALEKLGEPDLESRSTDHTGRRLVRIDGGFLVLNFMRYRDRDITAAQRARRYREHKKRKEQEECDYDDDRHAVTSRENPSRHTAEAEAEADAEAEAEADLPTGDRGVGEEGGFEPPPSRTDSGNAEDAPASPPMSGASVSKADGGTGSRLDHRSDLVASNRGDGLAEQNGASPPGTDGNQLEPQGKAHSVHPLGGSGCHSRDPAAGRERIAALEDAPAVSPGGGAPSPTPPLDGGAMENEHDGDEAIQGESPLDHGWGALRRSGERARSSRASQDRSSLGMEPDRLDARVGGDHRNGGARHDREGDVAGTVLTLAPVEPKPAKGKGKRRGFDPDVVEAAVLEAGMAELHRVRALAGFKARAWVVGVGHCEELLARLREGLVFDDVLEAIRAIVWQDSTTTGEGPIADAVRSGKHANLTRIFRPQGAGRNARTIDEWRDAGKPDPSATRTAGKRKGGAFTPRGEYTDL